MVRNIKFTREDTTDNSLQFLDCVVHIEEKSTHADQYILFDYHHLWNTNLEESGPCNTEWKMFPISQKGKEHTHVKKALKTCGYSN